MQLGPSLANNKKDDEGLTPENNDDVNVANFDDFGADVMILMTTSMTSMKTDTTDALQIPSHHRRAAEGRHCMKLYCSVSNPYPVI